MMKCKAEAPNSLFFLGVAALVLSVALPLFSGCASDKAAERTEDRNIPSSSSKAITGVEVVQQPASVDVLIRGNQSLAFTSVSRPFPPALVLYFTETNLPAQEGKQEIIVPTPSNEIIQSVSASLIEEEAQGKTARVEIALQDEQAPYEIIRQNGGDVRVSFQRSGSGDSNGPYGDDLRSERGGRTLESKTDGRPFSIDPDAPTASRLQSIYATKLADSLKVFVGADGAITNYKAFTIDSPARIVFDIFNVKSPYKNEKMVAVDTHWVRRIRYYGYPDRLRLVLETDKKFLSDFSAYPVDNGLLIHVGEDASYVSRGPRSTPGRLPNAERMDYSGMSQANRLQSVYATQLNNGISVTVRGDGAITDYKTSTLEQPATIVLDLFNLKNPYEQEHSFPVDTQWVKRVSYESMPDNRLRVYIETKPQYLSAFSAQPAQDGLIVRVGGVSGGSRAPLPDTSPLSSTTMAAADFRSPPPRTSGKPAWVDRIDFVGEEAGKSTLVIGTTKPIPYDVATTGDRSLTLKLYNTRIPDYRRRPLITDRFESAVDEILPAQETGGRDASTIFKIDLREAVPYFVEQTDDLLMVHFEASSISPKPLEVTAGPDLASGTVAVPAMDQQGIGQIPTEQPGRASMDSPGTDPTSVGLSPDAMMAQPPGDPGLPTDLPGSEGPQYTGERIALDFYETDIKNVFRILREVSGKNFAVDNDVTGKVTLTLEHPVPWDQVLDLVLKMNQLGKTFEGDIIRIATRETLKREEQERQEKLAAEKSVQEQQKALEPLFTEYIAINYSNAQEEILPHLEKIMTKDRGTLSVDTRTNMIIMTDTAEKIKQAKEIVDKLDRVTPQVIIEARVVEATSTFSKAIGTEWGASGGVNENTVESGAIAQPGFGPQRGYNVLGGTYGWDMAMNLPVTTAAGSIGFNFLRIAGTPLALDAKLMAMETTGDAKIISAPKILTLDNKTATIKQGISYPIQTVEDGEVNVEFKDVDLLLEVTPHVTPDNRISMNINITKNDLGQIIAGEQAFTTKEARTELLVNDGDTVVIGGIIKTTERNSNNSIPGLSRIPLLGWFFKSTDNSEDKEELLIFITPRIVQLEQRPTTQL